MTMLAAILRRLFGRARAPRYEMITPRLRISDLTANEIVKAMQTYRTIFPGEDITVAKMQRTGIQPESTGETKKIRG